MPIAGPDNVFSPGHPLIKTNVCLQLVRRLFGREATPFFPFDPPLLVADTLILCHSPVIDKQNIPHDLQDSIVIQSDISYNHVVHV